MKTIILFGLVLGALSAAGKVYIAGVGDTITLECGINSFNSRLDWSHVELILRFQINGFSTKGSSAIKARAKKKGQTNMEISNVMESDSGKFTCDAGGSVHEHHLIVVSVSVVPSDPVKVGADATLECKTNSGVLGQLNPKVEWQKPDGSVQTKPKVELKPVASSDKGAWQCIVSHQEEKFTKTVIMNVEVVPTTTPTLIKNPKSSDLGNGKNSTAVGGSDHPKLLLGLVWWIWVAIGAGGLVVIILIIVIIVMHKRNKRKKKKFLRMKKTQLSQKPKQYCQCVRQTAAAKPQQGRRREKPPALPRQPLLRE